MITRDEVQKLADLVLIDVPEAELGTIAKEMDAILGYVSEVKELAGEAAERVKPELYNVMRDDEVTNKPHEYTEALLNEVPDRSGDSIRVKKIL